MDNKPFIYTLDKPLVLGKAYSAAATLPVVRTPKPRNYLKAIKLVRYLPASTVFVVREVRRVRSKRWYHIQQGWISELALCGKAIQEERK